MGKYVTVKEAAKILNLTEQVVRNYIYLGRLEAKKVFNSTVIPVKEIENYLKKVKANE